MIAYRMEDLRQLADSSCRSGSKCRKLTSDFQGNQHTMHRRRMVLMVMRPLKRHTYFFDG
jgi:hypothetical protein